MPGACSSSALRVAAALGVAAAFGLAACTGATKAEAEAPASRAEAPRIGGSLSYRARMVPAVADGSNMRCGDEQITVDVAPEGDAMRLQVGGETFDLRQVRTASGAKYEAVGDPTTSFWSKGQRGTLVVRGRRYPDCVSAASAPAALRAGGNEPGWRLDIDAQQLVLSTDYGRTRLTAPAPAPQRSGEFTRYAATADGRAITVTVIDRPCSDSMSGMPHPLVVEVLVDGKRYAGCGGEPASLLRGAEWVVEDIDRGGIIDNSRLTLNFGDDGRVGGRASCNDYSGQYSLTGENLTINETVSTMKACAPALMQQEQKFFDVLGAVHRFELTGEGALQLYTADGRSITARRL